MGPLLWENLPSWALPLPGSVASGLMVGSRLVPFYKQWKLLEQTSTLTSGRYNDKRIVLCGRLLSACGVRELA